MNATSAPGRGRFETFGWLLRREYWENRGGFLWAPAIAGSIVSVLFLLLAIVGTIAGRRSGDGFVFDGPADEAHAVLGSFGDGTMLAGVGLAGVVLAFVVFFYALGSLYDDRRDRSLLFWKSLPVSDTQTVLSKAAWALLLAPLLAAGVGLLIGLALWVIAALTLTVNGGPATSAVFTQSHPLRIIGGVLASLPVYVLWALPAVGWLMLCSAWARSKPFLWAVLVPILGCVILSMMDILPGLEIPHDKVWYTVVYRGLMSVVPGTWFAVLGEDAAHATGIDTPQELAGAIDPTTSWHMFATVDLWIGAVVGVAFLYAAIHLRRWRDEA